MNSCINNLPTNYGDIKTASLDSINDSTYVLFGCYLYYTCIHSCTVLQRDVTVLKIDFQKHKTTKTKNNKNPYRRAHTHYLTVKLLDSSFSQTEERKKLLALLFTN